RMSVVAPLPYVIDLSLPYTPHHLNLHSFPTRRSSDLETSLARASKKPMAAPSFPAALARHGLPPLTRAALQELQVNVGRLCNQRSEEHTSELQSHLNIVCRLLLEKKKLCPPWRKASTIYSLDGSIRGGSALVTVTRETRVTSCKLRSPAFWLDRVLHYKHRQFIWT